MTIPAEATEIVLPDRVDPEGLLIRRRDVGAVAPGHVRLRMEATGVSFAEQQMRRGTYFDQPAFPFVPGYDLVGAAIAVGPGADPSLVGRRFAVVTKTGAWASVVDVEAEDLLQVPGDLDAGFVEALIVNGITAWQMLHDTARVRSGATIVVLGASGGVGTTLVQLARHAGIRVIATASRRHHDLVRGLGATAVVDSRDPHVFARLRDEAPDGVDAVFDHLGGPALSESWRLLRRGGALVSYGSASTKDAGGNTRMPVIRNLVRALGWNLLPNGRSAHLYNLWAGRRHRARFIARQQEALTNVLDLVAVGAIRPQIASRLPLSDIVRAMRLAESGTVAGKVVVTADDEQ